MRQSVIVDLWQGCYPSQWKGLCTAASFQHPAKYSRPLIQRIYQHAAAEGWLQAGATVLDCFGGVALGGLDAGLAGIQYLGVELEPRFCAIAHGFDCGGDVDKHEACSTQEEHGPHHVEGNLELWQRRYGHLPQWVAPVLLQGDSRELEKVLRKADCVVSSPPWANQLINHDTPESYQRLHDKVHANGKGHGGSTGASIGQSYGTTAGNLGNLPPGSVDACLSSPPHCHGLSKEHTYADHAKREKDSQRRIMTEKGIADPYYGQHPAQLGNLPAGSVEVVVSSPPYAQGCSQQGYDYHPDRMVGTRTGYLQRDANGYGTSLENLGNLPAGSVDGCVSSPPWDDGAPPLTPTRERVSSSPKDHGGPGPQYQTMASLGTPDTFWSAAKTILAQVYALLKPGGHAIFVLKHYVRDGQMVDFPGDWQRLCEACGFRTLHEHHALLVDSHSEMGLFGEPVEMYRREAKSFFRRLAEKGGSPRIDYETVLCMVKA